MLALKTLPAALGALQGKKPPKRKRRWLPLALLFLLGNLTGAYLRDSADAPIDKARCLTSLFR